MKGITSPEGIIMFIVAISLDLIGIIIFVLGTWFGVDDYGILEVVATIIIGTWMLIRYSSLGSEGGMKNMQSAEDELEEESPEGEALPEKEKSEKEGGSTDTNATKREAPEKDTPSGTKPENAKPATGGKAGSSTATSSKKGLQGPKGAIKDQAKELAKKALKRFGLTFIIELIPFLGGLYPGWTIFVWKEMKEKPSEPKQTMKKSDTTKNNQTSGKETMAV